MQPKVEKTLNLIDILNPYLCIVFCNSRDNANDLARSLNEAGIKSWYDSWWFNAT